MNEYEKRVIEGRKQFLKLTQQQEKELLDIYDEAGKQISYKLSRAKEGSLTSRHLNEMGKAIKQYTAELRNNLSKTIKDGIEASSQIATAIQLDYMGRVVPTQDLKSTFNNMFTQLPSDITKQLISGNYYSDGKALDKRIWDLTDNNAKAIDSLIKVNIAKGANARELAKELDSYINPKNRLKSAPIYIKNKDGKLVKAPLPDGISYNVSYQARRLARTSLSHAATESYIQGSKMNPFCRGLKWNLSPSHYERQVAKYGVDECDERATQNSYELGQGVFPIDKYPIGHPNCLCYPTQEVMDIDKARDELIAWLNGENNPKLDKCFDDYAEEFGIDINESKAFNELRVSNQENNGIIKTGTINATGAIPRSDYKRRDIHAELYYEEIRKRKSDISSIAKNVGWKESAIKEIKEHVFLKEHLLGGIMQKFAPDYDQAQAWQRLIDGKSIKESDLVFIKHEYVELTQMRLHGYDYITAHEIANGYYDWWGLIEGDE